MKIALIAMLVGLFTVATTVSANQAAVNTGKSVKVANAKSKTKKSKKSEVKEDGSKKEEVKTETTTETAPAK